MDGKKIKEIRNKLEISQEKFAEIIGVSKNTISSWENDGIIPKTKIPQLLNIEKQIEYGIINSKNVNIKGHYITSLIGNVHIYSPQTITKEDLLVMMNEHLQSLKKKDDEIEKLQLQINNLIETNKLLTDRLLII